MPKKSSFALVFGAFVFLAFWGVGLASVEIDPASAGVTADGYGVSMTRAVVVSR